MQLQSLGQKDPLEEGMATHCSVLAWRIPWTEEPGGLQSIGHKELDTTEATDHAHTTSFNLVNSIYGVGLFISLKRKLGFRDIKKPAQDDKATQSVGI